MRRLLVVLALVSFGCGDRYTYTQRTSSSGRTEPVRVDRASGRTEILTQRSGGTPEWIAVRDAPVPVTNVATVATAPSREAVLMPASEISRVPHQCRWVEGPKAGVECTIANNSSWDVLSIHVYVTLNGFEKKFSMDWGSDAIYLAGLPQVPLQPGQSATWKTLVRDPGYTSYRVVGMSGYEHR